MKFFCLHAERNQTTPRLLEESCKKVGLEFISIDPTTYSFVSGVKPKPGDLFYRATDVTTKGAEVLEYYFISQGVVTLYKKTQPFLPQHEEKDFIVLEQNDIPTPTTIWHINNNKKLLREYAELLGLPVILKALGGSHGVGVMKIESLSSLFSVVDYAFHQSNELILRKFVDVRTSARLVVLGDQVIDSIEYTAPSGDFRSNEGSVPNVHAKEFSTQVKDIAIKAVSVLDLEFGGVDILIDQENKMYVTEVNFPCYFARAQMITGAPISDQIVEYLVKKAQNVPSLR